MSFYPTYCFILKALEYAESGISPLSLKAYQRGDKNLDLKNQCSYLRIFLKLFDISTESARPWRMKEIYVLILHKLPCWEEERRKKTFPLNC